MCSYSGIRSIERTLRADLHDTILSHATSSRQAYGMTYDCRSVLKRVLKCYDVFSDVHNDRKSCRGPVVSRCRMRQKSYRVNRPLDSSARTTRRSTRFSHRTTVRARKPASFWREKRDTVVILVRGFAKMLSCQNNSTTR